MKNKTEIAVGALTILGILAFILGFKFIKGEDIFTRANIITVGVEKTNNLMTSNMVLYNGVPIGRVSEINVSNNPKYNVLITMSIDKDVQIPIDSKFEIVAMDMLGKMGISLLKGKSGAFASEKDILPCGIQSGVFDQVAGSITPLSEKAQELILNLNSMVKNLNTTLGTGDNSLLKNAVTDLSKTLNSVNGLVGNLNTTLDKSSGDLQGILKNVNSLTAKFNNESGKIDSILTNFESLSGKLAAIDLEKTIGSANKTLDELQKTLKLINEGDGSVSKLLKEDGVYNDITKTINSLNAVLNDLKANPKKYISLSLIDRTKTILVSSDEDSALIASGKKKAK